MARAARSAAISTSAGVTVAITYWASTPLNGKGVGVANWAATAASVSRATWVSKFSGGGDGKIKIGVTKPVGTGV